jgi:predicted XRE-type DNA-binding protein
MAKPDYMEGSGNVFADLGFAEAEEMLIKAELAQKIGGILQKRRLTQAQAAAILGVDQPKVSALLCGRLSRFSMERLMQFLLLLGRDVSITIKPRHRVRARSHTRALRRNAGVSNRGRLSVDEIVAVRASKDRRDQQGSQALIASLSIQSACSQQISPRLNKSLNLLWEQRVRRGRSCVLSVYFRQP